MKEQIVEQIILALKENVDELENIEIRPNTMLISSGYIDSFELINLITIFEGIFDVEIPLDNMDLDVFNTPHAIANLIGERMPECDSISIQTAG